jgi:hypothetical protein
MTTRFSQERFMRQMKNSCDINMKFTKNILIERFRLPLHGVILFPVNICTTHATESVTCLRQYNTKQSLETASECQAL